ncbi:MAG: signal peptide peptidase SppA [Nitrospirae bacterium]|nr:signal peptide peptidase SppA [Nitrospirota bacterium]
MARRPLVTGLLLFLVLAVAFFLGTYLTAWFMERPPSGSDQIALVRIEGVILSADEPVEQLRTFAENPAIKAILIRIDSPGGAVVPSQEIYDEVKKIRAEGKQKVVVSMGTVAASGGYYIAAASDKIVANPGTLTGSIGVIMELPNFEGLMKKIGVEATVIKSGAHKDLVSPFRAMGQEERQILQRVMDDVHDQFIQAVSDGRGLEKAAVTAIADGQVFTGRQAKEKGLVDEIGSFEDAIKLTGELAGIVGRPSVVEPKRPFSLSEWLKSEFQGQIGAWANPAPSIRLNYLWTWG